MDFPVEGVPIPVSALSHYSYCPRRYALVHQEQTFEENTYTLRGNEAHRRVEEGWITEEDGVQIERSMPIWSEKLGLIGKADVVEMRLEGPYPVEYKHGKRRLDGHSDVQICAQAMCLEEMLKVEIHRGAIYHVSSRQRREVILNTRLRDQVHSTITAIRQIQRCRSLPPPVNDARCPPCSLIDACMPSVTASTRRLQVLHKDLFSP